MFLSFIGAAQNNALKIITHIIMSCTVVLASSGINAAIMASSSGCIVGPDSATCTLADLFPRSPEPGVRGTETVTVDRISFGGWTFLGSDDALGAGVVSPEDVSVIFSQNGRRINLDFISESLHSGDLEGNFSFAYQVSTPNDPHDLINKMDISLVDYDIDGDPAEVTVDTCLFTLDCGTGGAPRGIEVFARTFGDPPDQTFQTASFSPPLRSFDISTHIFVSGSPSISGLSGGSAELNEFRQSFYKVPEPSTLTLILLPGLMLVAQGSFKFQCS